MKTRICSKLFLYFTLTTAIWVHPNAILAQQVDGKTSLFLTTLATLNTEINSLVEADQLQNLQVRLVEKSDTYPVGFTPGKLDNESELKSVRTIMALIVKTLTDSGCFAQNDQEVIISISAGGTPNNIFNVRSLLPAEANVYIGDNWAGYYFNSYYFQEKFNQTFPCSTLVPPDDQKIRNEVYR